MAKIIKKTKEKVSITEKESGKSTSVDTLNIMFNPKNIVVIGASRKENSVGYGILKNLARGGFFLTDFCKPFEGKIYAINPNADFIQGYKCYKKVNDVPEEVDLAVICVPAKIIMNVVRDCIRKQVKGAVIISAGFAELGEEGKKLQKKIIEMAEQGGLRIIGPNCLGIIRPSVNMNASFAPTMPPKGEIAFVSQSGALADSVIDWSVMSKYGFSTIISYGNQADLGVCDFLEWLGQDEQTKAITLYIEGLNNGRKFIETAKKISKTKPIIAIKAGRTEKGMKAISSHTGSLAGAYEIYKCAFKQSGIMAADSVEELFDFAEALAYQQPCKENNIAIITNGGGCGVLTADYCEELGVNLAEIKKSTIKQLDKTGKMHSGYSRSNPLDIIGDALPERYEAAIKTLIAEKDIYGLIVIQTLQTMTNPEQNARIIVEAQKEYPDKPIICVFMGGRFTKSGWKILRENKIPNFNDPQKAARAMKKLIERGKWLNNN